MGEIIIFAKHGGGNVPKQGKQGEIRNLWSMTKKSQQKFLRMKIQKFFGKRVKFLKFSRKSENFPKIGGNLKQRGNASWPQGDGRP